ncbi:SWIM zinc finger family protein [Sphingobacterium sp. DK4209]|uniref:SWIM zinc finger family protein n=1 Tax=Sphingobacterium zhuxiongii TaxID=2662364 RepID=A0A5Q0QH24_9SPHI|nr:MULTISPECIES: SWIM zinc finger family protein [unclassified Sphingobacterium]MVZ64684.1 SWIM zinc finger family protein [Sphingobacterium sp. DK4209]QGA27022.1 SWIM zinc finger family protein [Sphingobacterium sp. dk4302]
MATTDIAISYSGNSVLTQKSGIQQLVLSHQAELTEINNVPCFFWGNLTDPLTSAKCLMTLSKVVRSSFGPIPPSLRDPIVSAGTDQIRFEGFSSCNGVYARLDLLEDAIDGEFLASGTTNVDFNEPMLNALNAVKKTEKMILGVGSKEVSISTSKGKIVEKKVRLPERWIKGLTSVQLYLAGMEQRFNLNKVQVVQLFQSIPKGATKGTFYLSQRANRFVLTPVASQGAVRIGGIQRLRLLEGILPYIDNLTVYQELDGESSSFVADFKTMRMTLSLSPDSFRGFSGEGNVLENMVQDVPDEWVLGVNSLLNSNEMFDPTLLSIEHDVDFSTMDSLTASLSSVGLLGYDLHNSQHYYRRLPFKMERILALNPRLKNAKKLVATQGVEILKDTEGYIEARVAGSDVKHTVILQGEQSRCTCDWFTNHQGKRGLCKHILAVKMLSN